MMNNGELKIFETMLHNGISEWGSGGCLFSTSSMLSVSMSSFNNCRAVNGGAVFASDSRINILRSGFKNNIGYRDGGAFVLGQRTDTAIEMSEFQQNKAECPYLNVTSCPDWGDSFVLKGRTSGIGFDSFLYILFVSIMLDVVVQ